ncbi:hypothetical protein AB0H23_33095 [Streptomyces albogriseolus]|uniref:GNAT family N-acetyltransferase n=1 Tax=Streptomyces albogriseolus TaxID=1887 RepID=UPI003460A4DB
MSKGVPGLPPLRPLGEEDLPRLFEIQLNEGARQLAAFVTEETKDREAYKEVAVRPIHARVAEDNAGSVRVLERNGFVRIGSEDSFAGGRQATVTALVYKLG